MTAQERNTQLTIVVSSVEGDNLKGQTIVLEQTDYQVKYGELFLNAEGKCVLKVYPGNHLLTVNRDGFMPLEHSFVVEESQIEKTVTVSLAEKTRAPFALKAEVSHNVFDGTNNIALSWNKEAPAFFDDFESYSPFSIAFGEWTGIDGDEEAAAPLVGIYPNRGVMQYAQIINPLTVNPTWWYDYPILRPYSGQQYVGFTRTSSGNANDDWLISPTITVGTDNVLNFMGKAADQFPERFMVYVTTKIDAPVQDDFTRIDLDNYETADYTGWKRYEYDLSAYAGKQIKFAIRYISHYNRYGSFMLMIDDVYVGQPREEEAMSRRFTPFPSAANPYEKFKVYLDGQLKLTTEDYECELKNVSVGDHTVGIQAVYIKAESETTTVQVNVPAVNYSHIVFNVTANSSRSADGQVLSVTNLSTSETYELTIQDGKAEMFSLPSGEYVINVAEGAFEHVQKTFTVNGDATIEIVLSDHIIAPYNITATLNDKGVYVLRWNQELVFSDSFEDYPDFATGKFGEWESIDVDQNPVYPVALGNQSNIVSFPGSGTATTPTAIAPMVFNPWKTEPAMLPTDKAIAAPTGDKTVIFFSSQRTMSDKWLISPLLDIHEKYVLTVKAKGYSSMYPESMEFCVSDGSTIPTDFQVLSTVDNLASEQWALYETDLAAYVGQKIRLAVHYNSMDAFMAQIDDFTVGPEDGQGEIVDYGNVVRYEISVDGKKVGESVTSVFELPELSDEEHVIGIKAIYKSGESQVTEYILRSLASISYVMLDASAPMTVYNLSGICLGNNLKSLPAGIYFVKQNGRTLKIRK